jgi:hypothetical protein
MSSVSASAGKVPIDPGVEEGLSCPNLNHKRTESREPERTAANEPERSEGGPGRGASLRE